MRLSFHDRRKHKNWPSQERILHFDAIAYSPDRLMQDYVRRLLAPVLASVLALSPVTGANMALADTLILMSGMEGQLVSSSKEPAANMRLVRTWHWAWTDARGQDETTTDAQGRFRFPPVTGRSMSARFMPHEPDILQTITAQSASGPVEIWSARKSNYLPNGELQGQPLHVLCGLDGVPGSDNDRLFNSLCVIDSDAPGREGHPQIFEAIEDRNHDRVARLIASGVNVEARGFGQRTPILKAAMTHSWTIAEMLLAAGADPMVPDEFGITLPAVAARSRLKPESDEGQALARVWAILAERGLIGLVFPPDQVRTMVAEGRWPPPPQ